MTIAEVFARLALLATFLMSSPILRALGLRYDTSGGTLFEKVHPSLWAVVAALCAAFVLGSPKAPTRRAEWWSATLLLTATVLTVAWALVVRSSAPELSAPIVTFGLPALVLFVFIYTDPGYLRWLGPAITWLFGINSAIAVLEFVFGFRVADVLGPAGYSGRRSSALFGYPLTNATLLGGYLVYLVMDCADRRPRLREFALIALHLAAMMAFGGRAATVLAAALLAAFFVFRAIRSILSNNLSALVQVLVVLGGVVIAWSATLFTGVGSVLIDRFVNDYGSAETRHTALHLVRLLSPGEWLTGLGPARRQIVQILMGTPLGIESFPLALLVTYGLPISAILVLSVVLAVFSIGRRAGSIGFFQAVYFLAVTSTSLSLGSKTTLLAGYLFMMMGTATQAHLMRAR